MLYVVRFSEEVSRSRPLRHEGAEANLGNSHTIYSSQCQSGDTCYRHMLKNHLVMIRVLVCYSYISFIP